MKFAMAHSLVHCIVSFIVSYLFYAASSSWLHPKHLRLEIPSPLCCDQGSTQSPVEFMQCDATDLTFQYNSYCSKAQDQLSNKHNGTSRTKTSHLESVFESVLR